MSACPACRGIPCRCFDRSKTVILQPGEPVKRCDGCEHWAAGMPVYQDDRIIGHMGSCRRRAPVVTVNQNHVARTRWPETRDEDNCGEFEKAAQ